MLNYYFEIFLSDIAVEYSRKMRKGVEFLIPGNEERLLLQGSFCNDLKELITTYLFDSNDVFTDHI